MNITHEEVLAVLVLKERRIVNLEAQLAAAQAEAAELRKHVEELKKDYDTGA